jgi:hypothetical protein
VLAALVLTGLLAWPGITRPASAQTRPAEPASARTGAPMGGGLEASMELSELVWMAGHWMGEAFGGWIEEGWFGPAGKSMTGVFRLVRDDLAVMYELLVLEQDEDGEIYYRFKHIGRGWIPQEETRLEYRLTELEGRKATFRSTADAPSAGAPWWFTYESPTDDALLVSVYGTSGDPLVLEMTRR